MMSSWLAPASVFGVAVLLRVALLALRPFDGLYGQDAFAYYDYAVTLRSALLHGQPPPAFFWPIGFPLHLVLAFSAIGVSSQAAQVVSILAGALVAPVTYLLAREVLTDRDAGRARTAALIAGLIVAVSGQLLISSLSIMSDATALLWATTAAWCVVRYARTRQWPWFGLAVFALSMAVITRWAMALLAVPWTLAVLLTWRKHWTTISWRRAAVLIATAVIIGGIIVGGQLLSGSHTGDLSVVGWNPSNALQREVVNTDGVFHYEWPMAMFYAQPVAHPAYVFPLLLPMLLIGLWSLRKVSPPASVLLIGWPLIAYVFLSGIAWQNPRFMVAYLPPLAVWVAIGVERIWPRTRRWQWLVAIYLGVSVVGASLWGMRVVANFIDRKDADLEVVRQLDRLVPPDGTLIAFGLTATAQHYLDRTVIELFNLDDAALDRSTRGATTYLLIDTENVEAQWQNKAPALNYHWLQAQGRLEPIATLLNYQLFRLDRS